MSYDPIDAAFEIREQLVSDKRRIAFFFGAGTSMAVGVPGIKELTLKVLSNDIVSPFKESLDKIKLELSEEANIESILNRIRIYKELIGDSEELEYNGIRGRKYAINLDPTICNAICHIIGSNPSLEPEPHYKFAQWIRSLCFNRNYPVEIFTTNYDVLFEKAMERFGVPYFDGFVGSVDPFFVPESVDAEVDSINDSSCPPRSWTRLWKIHGSINWFNQKNTRENQGRIIRRFKLKLEEGEELLIYPSRDKYMQSRKLPFIAFQDRLHRFISTGERLVIILGYSFSDQHLNEILFQGLRSNPHLAITAFIYENLSKELENYGKEYRNLTIYGPDKATIGGLIEEWDISSKFNQGDVDNKLFWNEEKKNFLLGDFNYFTSFIEKFVGFNSLSNLSSDSKMVMNNANINEDKLNEK